MQRRKADKKRRREKAKLISIFGGGMTDEAKTCSISKSHTHGAV